MMRTSNQLFVLAYVLVLLSCNGSKTSRRVPAEQSAIAANPQTSGQTMPPSSDPNQGKPSDSDPSNQGKPSSGEALPPYLMSLEQAQAITTLIEPYQRPPFQEEPLPGVVSTNYSQLRSFIENFSNKVFLLPNLKPGRTFKVTIMEDEVFNASADGFQNIFINTGLVKTAGSLGSLEVVCHEMAHSSKNHSLKNPENMLSEAQKNTLNQFHSKLDAYMNLAFDAAAGVYTHDRAQYLQLRQQWDQVGPELSNFFKHNKSEADVVGGMICAELGLAPIELLTAMKENNKLAEGLLAEQSKQEDPTKIPDKTRINMTREEAESFVQYFLFPLASHPTDVEREKQIERVTPAIELRYRSVQTLVSEWKTEMASQSGLSLTGGPDPSEIAKNQIITLTSSSGQIIKVIKPFGCEHEWIRHGFPRTTDE
ncbi:MAG: M48 family metalloprotease [Proteobacteria bacterium]|nr:M48 family metalloprotease [Pseudomonadota bacterium]